MGANYVLLETITVGEAGASSVTFNNIPQSGYTDLKIVCSTRSSVAGGATWMNNDVYFNNTLATNSEKNLQGNGSSASSENGSTLIYSVATNGTANTFASSEIYIPNYSVNGIQKSASSESVTESNATGSVANMGASLWTTTSPITSIKLQPVSGGGSYLQYSTFSLYGLAAVGTTPVIAPYASGGDIIQTDGTYWYHAFLSSGTFTPAKGLSCDVLVVAGGGGGGQNTNGNKWGAGGGGGGGVYYSASTALTANTVQTCTIGAGGSGGSNSAGTQGGNSIFGFLTTAVGGGYGGYPSGTSGTAGGGAGGSGGGSAYPNTANASATSGQGSVGGANNGGNGAGAGGGGATGAGSTNSINNGGAGGAGTSAYSSWGSATTTGQNVSSTFWFAGGGGGGSDGNTSFNATGGNGGGGQGSAASGNASTGLANTGGGGGGAWAGAAGKGGSGIVIVRYAI